MELKQLISLLRRWWWLLILGLILGAASGILINRMQTPVYQATAKIMVMRVPDGSALGLAYLGDQQLAQTFTELITIQPVLGEASSNLGFTIDPTQIKIQQNTNSQIIKVIVEDTDPQRSAKIANALVETAINHYVALQVGQYVSLEDDIQSQLNFLQARIFSLQSQISLTSEMIIKSQMEQIQSQMTPLQNEVSQLQKDIAQLTSVKTPQTVLIAEKQARLNQILPLLNAYQEVYSNLVVLKKPLDIGSVDENKLALLEKTLATYQQNYSDLMSKLVIFQESQKSGISNVTIIQDASVLVDPVRPQVLINVLLTTAVGFILAVVVVFMMENLDITMVFPKIIRKWFFLLQVQKKNHSANK